MDNGEWSNVPPDVWLYPVMFSTTVRAKSAGAVAGSVNTNLSFACSINRRIPSIVLPLYTSCKFGEYIQCICTKCTFSS